MIKQYQIKLYRSTRNLYVFTQVIKMVCLYRIIHNIHTVIIYTSDSYIKKIKTIVLLLYENNFVAGMRVD